MNRRLGIALFLMSAVVLGLEITLMRLWMIAEYHHLSYFVISTALLGFGTSGTLISLFREKILDLARTLVWVCAWGVAVTAPISFQLCQRLPLQSLELLWNPIQWMWVLAIQLLLFVPFLLAAMVVGLILILKASQASRWYALNLVGSGVGACLFVLLQYLLPVQALLSVAAALAGIAALALPLPASKATRPLNAALCLATLGVIVLNLQSEIRINEYKALPSLLRLRGSKIVLERNSPLGRIDAVEGPAIHEGVDLSPVFTGKLPPQTMLTFDGGYGTVLNRIDSATATEFLDWSIPAAVFALIRPRTVAIVGSGGGSDILLGRRHGVKSILALDLNPQVIDLVRGPLAQASGEVYALPGVRVEIAEARHWFANTAERFDLIVVPLLDSVATASSGVHALNENYLYTLEGIETLLNRLAPGGCLSIVRWVQFPPRDAIKMAATLIEALRRRGAEEPADHFAAVRFQFAANLMVSDTPFDPGRIQELKEFCRTRNFQPVWYPGMPAEEAGAYHEIGSLNEEGRIVGKAAIHDAIREFLEGDSEEYHRKSLYDVRPTSDDRPYYFNFLKWKIVPVLRRMGPNAAAQMEYGTFVLVMSFVQAVIVAGVLILVPLNGLGKSRKETGSRAVTLIYFFSIGLAYLFLEMAFIQKIALFLGDPVLAAAVVLSGFLLFSGFGSLFGERLGSSPFKRIARAVFLIQILGVVYLWKLPSVLSLFGDLPLAGRCLMGLCALGPLAAAMGVPFSQGLELWARVSPGWVPWAWGVNGFGSVMAASGAVLISMSMGFRVLVFVSLALYLAAGIASWRARAGNGSTAPSKENTARAWGGGDATD